ncbi:MULTISPECIES: ferric reductase-like transmembrane domain-containing protein [Halocynthiibacter]|uniref:Ferric reductase-like transmembrane domain-containing protein n=1 Tax=Halocynthiibacter halioticoli TaxID=2986804 RepID=A0AAE3LUT9_9RHOB|nr:MULTISPECIES: ferric reductase-like transmembrane domain-containing protein [Halocynthiibacter]MCV6825795.1 ferric reductase-like transmembrane domain-containing protein [Halocynthiibacter halioticoli]MCW4058796.1 ferric reductase-like transmembrane domain-containing protein [Halocynthiibacter sp. SDUM655004]
MRVNIWTVLCVLTATVLLAVPWLELAGDGVALPWGIYLQLLFATGFLSVTLMSVAMVLSLRNPRVENWVGGLDRSYRLHRRAAQWGVGFGLAHYLIKLGSKQLRKAELLTKPEGYDSGIPAFFDPLHDLAKLAGEWGLYVAIALVAVALIQAISYRQFVRLHRIFPVIYLGFVLHAVVFMPLAYWINLTGAVLSVSVVGGLIASGLSLSGRIGRSRQVQGRVTQVQPIGNDVLEVIIEPGPAWPGHQAGQFALFTFDTKEGSHPFTLASAWESGAGPKKIRIAIKALGDYTSTLPGSLAEGAPVRIEGPYGRFDFDNGKGRQIWIAGGIGLTPFVARLEHRTAQPMALEPVDLFFSTRGVSSNLLDRIQKIAEAGHARLHVVDTGHDAPIDAALIMQAVPDWHIASIWFCGPAGFGDALETAFHDASLPRGKFHREAFAFR